MFDICLLTNAVYCALLTVFVLLHIPCHTCIELCCHSHFLPAYSAGEVEDTLPASRVISSPIPGYDGGEVDTSETVEVMFPLNVRKCISHNVCYKL